MLVNEWNAKLAGRIKVEVVIKYGVHLIPDKVIIALRWNYI
jgi:hypothetical protein